MKFDYCVGNPPYQIETAQKDTDNGQKTTKRIFGEFQIETESIAKNICLIYPAMGWVLGGSKGLKEFGHKQINDVHLKALKIFRNATDVFPNVGIGDGISVVLKDMEREREQFDYTYVTEHKEYCIKASHPGDELFIVDPNQISIVDKVKKYVSQNCLNYLSDSILPQKLFAVESNFVEENPDKVRLYHDGDILNNNEIKLYANDKSGKAGRTTWFIIDKKYIPQGQEYIDKYKVVVSSANIASETRDWTFMVLEPNTAFGRSRLGIKMFNTLDEANNCAKYLNSTIIRFLFCQSGGALTVVGKLVPDLSNYIDSLDFNKDIDEQLKVMFNISNDEYNYISNTTPKNRKEISL